MNQATRNATANAKWLIKESPLPVAVVLLMTTAVNAQQGSGNGNGGSVGTDQSGNTVPGMRVGNDVGAEKADGRRPILRLLQQSTIPADAIWSVLMNEQMIVACQNRSLMVNQTGSLAIGWSFGSVLCT